GYLPVLQVPSELAKLRDSPEERLPSHRPDDLGQLLNLVIDSGTHEADHVKVPPHLHTLVPDREILNRAMEEAIEGELEVVPETLKVSGRDCIPQLDRSGFRDRLADVG